MLQGPANFAIGTLKHIWQDACPGCDRGGTSALRPNVLQLVKNRAVSLCEPNSTSLGNALRRYLLLRSTVQYRGFMDVKGPDGVLADVDASEYVSYPLIVLG